MFYNFSMHECMNGMVSILRFGLAVWIKGLWQTLLLEITVLLWMTSLFWTANNPTDHQVNHILYTWIFWKWSIVMAGFRKDLLFKKSIWEDADFEVLFPSSALPACGCSFEDGLCVWVQGAEERLDWLSRSGPTETPNTGPAGDHTTGKGHFNYSLLKHYTVGMCT